MISRPHFRKNEGMTLIEICFAIVIVGAIITMAIPAINSALTDTKRQQSDYNAQVFNQAASRARLAGKVGAGTYGSDKDAALAWYLSERLCDPKNYKLDWNTYQNGLWFSNLTPDLSNLIAGAAAGTLTEAQVTDALRRFKELTPELAQALITGGYLKASTDALAALNSGNTELYGNTLVTSTEASNLLTALDNNNDNGYAISVSNYSGLTDQWGQDWLKEIWTNPSYEDQRNDRAWKWDESSQTFVPNLNYNWPDASFTALKNSLTGIPEGSSLYKEIMAIYSIPYGTTIASAFSGIDSYWNTSQDKANLQVAAGQLQQKFTTQTQPILQASFDKVQALTPLTLAQAKTLPITYSASNLEQRSGTYTDSQGNPWDTYIYTYNPGTVNEWTQIQVYQNTPQDEYGNNAISAYLNYYVDHNGNLQWGDYSRFVTASDNWGSTQASISSSNGNTYATNGYQIQVSQGNSQHSFTGYLDTGTIANNPSSLDNPTSWANDLWARNPPSALSGTEAYANQRLQYTDPAAYAANIKL